MGSYEKKKEEQKAGSPAWMTTFSDLMTQILVFFVFLFTMSSIEKEKFQEALISFRGSFGVIPETFKINQRISEPPTEVYELSGMAEKQVEELVDEVEAYAEQQGMVKELYVDKTPEGIIVRLSDDLVFKSGSAEMTTQIMPVLKKLADIINKTPGKVRVEGHTDNVPINTVKFPSNWELSTSRAASIGQYLMKEGKVKPERLTLSGYGEYKPIFPNNSVENRAKNRRVDIVFLKK